MQVAVLTILDYSHELTAAHLLLLYDALCIHSFYSIVIASCRLVSLLSMTNKPRTFLPSCVLVPPSKESEDDSPFCA